jgi:Na+/melibiose symporter-like transporter
MWALIPEVISFAEYKTGRRISGIVNALTGIFFKAGMALGGVVPGIVLKTTGYVAKEQANTLPKDSSAWFYAMLIYAIIGLALLLFCFSQTKERVVMDQKETANVKVSDLWTEFMRNKPLRVIALFFITAFAMMSVGNAAGAYFMNDSPCRRLPRRRAYAGWCASYRPCCSWWRCSSSGSMISPTR